MATRHKKPAPRIAVIDAETDPFKAGRIPRPFAFEFYDGSETRQFWGDDCADQLADYIKENCDENTIVYAHNGGKFDFHFLLSRLGEDIKIINGRIAECSIGSAVLRDSFLILPLPLAAHAKTKIDYNKFEKGSRESHKTEILEYLHDDCVNLFDWVMKFIDRFGVRLTLAGTTFDVMKKQFNYHIEKTSETYDAKLREFYYGGRVQAFETGKISGPLVYLDINSAYPFAMLQAHPYGDSFRESRKLPDTAGCWFAEIDAESFGCLPMRGDEKLFYPNDGKRQRFLASGWEIVAGLETGTLKINKVHRVIKHNQSRAFVEYIRFFYDMKIQAELTGDKDARTFAKLMMNAAYGKFGQDSRDFEEYKLIAMGCDELDGFEYKADVGGAFELHARKSFISLEQWRTLKIAEQRRSKRPSFYNVATAASITGYVRAMLWQAICAAERPIYCDTDSLICQATSAPIGTKLGQWKVEAHVNTAWVGGRKFYSLDTTEGWKTATKGFRADAQTLAQNIEAGTEFEWSSEAPAFNIKRGEARFVHRKIKPEFNAENYF